MPFEYKKNYFLFLHRRQVNLKRISIDIILISFDRKNDINKYDII
jgi:hypothetical protein